MELDLLMLTQGWRTYDYHRSGPEVSSHGYPYENSQFISGEVKGFWGNDVKRPQLVIFQPDLKLFQIVQLEGTNRFVIFLFVSRQRIELQYSGCQNCFKES